MLMRHKPSRRMLATTSVGLALALAAASPAIAEAGGTNRQVVGTGTGTNTITFGVPTTFVADETADLSHLGNSTVHIEGSLTPIPGGALVEGSATVVAANGNTLTMTLAGSTANDPTGTVAAGVVVGQVTGGTGRFEGASGTITDHVVLTITSVNPSGIVAHIASSFSGEISY